MVDDYVSNSQRSTVRKWSLVNNVIFRGERRHHGRSVFQADSHRARIAKTTNGANASELLLYWRQRAMPQTALGGLTCAQRNLSLPEPEMENCYAQ